MSVLVIELTWNDLDPFYFPEEDLYNRKVALILLNVLGVPVLRESYAYRLLSTQ